MSKPKVDHENLGNMADMVGLTAPVAAALAFGASAQVQPFIGWPGDIDAFMTVVQDTCDMSTVMFTRFGIDDDGAEAVVVVWN